MLNNKVVAGSLSLALLAAPSLFGLDVASAAAYTKAAKKPTLAAAYTKAAKKTYLYYIRSCKCCCTIC